MDQGSATVKSWGARAVGFRVLIGTLMFFFFFQNVFMSLFLFNVLKTVGKRRLTRNTKHMKHIPN